MKIFHNFLKTNTIYPALFLAGLVIVVFFPLISGAEMLKWDIKDLDLPFRYFISESIRATNR